MKLKIVNATQYPSHLHTLKVRQSELHREKVLPKVAHNKTPILELVPCKSVRLYRLQCYQDQSRLQKYYIEPKISGGDINFEGKKSSGK